MEPTTSKDKAWLELATLLPKVIRDEADAKKFLNYIDSTSDLLPSDKALDEYGEVLGAQHYAKPTPIPKPDAPVTRLSVANAEKLEKSPAVHKDDSKLEPRGPKTPAKSASIESVVDEDRKSSRKPNRQPDRDRKRHQTK